jgi:uncharacterized protein YhbP (UPF0306 family)
VHAADVYFACDEQLFLYFFSDPDSQHSRDMERDPRAAATIHAERENWELILGLQTRGVCSEVSSPVVWQQAWESYLEKFPFVKELEEVIKVNQLYRFTPSWIRLVDNKQGFGFKQEWQVRETGVDGEMAGRWELMDSQGSDMEVASG